MRILNKISIVSLKIAQIIQIVTFFYINLYYVALLNLGILEVLTLPFCLFLLVLTWLSALRLNKSNAKTTTINASICGLVFIQHLLVLFNIFYAKFEVTFMVRDYLIKYSELLEVANKLGFNVELIATLLIISCILSFTFHKELAKNIAYQGALNKKKQLINILLVISIFTTIFYSQFSISVKREITSNKVVLKTYTKLYQQELEKNRNGNLTEAINLENLKNKKENVFLIQLESLNTEFVNNVSTPEFLTITKEKGVLIKNFQASAVNTTSNQEVFLCGILPPLYKTTATNKTNTNELNCLPRILKEAGYKTIYMQLYDTGFANMDVFLKNIGFDEVLGLELFQDTDPKHEWGYTDGIAYERYFEYINDKYKDEKLFVHMAVGSINHYPFDAAEESIYDTYKNELPYQDTKNLRETITNTTYLQDELMGEALKRYSFGNYDNNSHLFIFGDHSFPIQVHENNYFNTFFAYQEGMVTALGYIPPASDRGSMAIGSEKKELVSNRMLPRTILEILDDHKESKGFTHLLINRDSSDTEEEQEKCVIAVQPFSGRYIAV